MPTYSFNHHTSPATFIRLFVYLLTFVGLAAAVSAGAAAPFFLPTGDEVHNTGNPRMVTDAQGNLHLVYPLVAGEGAVYAYCPADCQGAEQVSSVVFYTQDGSAVFNAMVAVDAGGVPHLLLATRDTVIYAECAGDCSTRSGWNASIIDQFGQDWELTGSAFALDPQGRPRYLLHAYQAYLGMGAPPPGTRLYSCDADCTNPDAWSGSTISEQSWLQPTFRYDAGGTAHVATVIPVDEMDLVAYFRCDGDCGDEQVDNWPGIGLGQAYSDLYIEGVSPAASLDLTADGGVRLAFIGRDGAGRYLAYFECEVDCTDGDGAGWEGIGLLHGEGAESLGDGIALALDEHDQPRLAYSSSSSILLGYCDGDCVGRYGDDDWSLVKAELADEIEPDDIFLYHNCTVGLWFLRQPALAISFDGLPLVAYRAEDISAGWTTTDSTKPACPAGVDMSMTRLAVLQSY